VNAAANHFSFLKPVEAPSATKPQGASMLDRLNKSMDAQIAMAKSEMDGVTPDAKHVFYKRDNARGAYSAKLSRKPFPIDGKVWFDAGPDLNSVVKFFESVKKAAEKDDKFLAELEEHSKRGPRNA